MKKKFLGIALGLLTLAAIGTVFAQECLTKNAARVKANGMTVVVINNMNNQPINVEVFYKNTFNGSSGSIETGAIGPLGQQTVTLPTKNCVYQDYTVWSCY